MTMARYNKNFVYLEETKNLRKKWNEDEKVKKTNIVGWETKISKIWDTNQVSVKRVDSTFSMGNM